MIKKRITLRKITLTGVMAALVYVSSMFLQIPIPTAVGQTRLHMGNVLCLLSGFLLGPLAGGLSAGIGSMLFDLASPAYVTSAPFTFFFKFMMACLCGVISSGGQSRRKWRYITGAAAGSFLYILLYLSKNFIEHHYVAGLPLDAVWLTLSQKALVSGANGVISTAVAVPLGLALTPALSRFLAQDAGADCIR